MHRRAKRLFLSLSPLSFPSSFPAPADFAFFALLNKFPAAAAAAAAFLGGSWLDQREWIRDAAGKKEGRRRKRGRLPSKADSFSQWQKEREDEEGRREDNGEIGSPFLIFGDASSKNTGKNFWRQTRDKSEGRRKKEEKRKREEYFIPQNVLMSFTWGEGRRERENEACLSQRRTRGREEGAGLPGRHKIKDSAILHNTQKTYSKN